LVWLLLLLMRRLLLLLHLPWPRPLCSRNGGLCWQLRLSVSPGDLSLSDGAGTPGGTVHRHGAPARRTGTA
jgi:hypothetical protein